MNGLVMLAEASLPAAGATMWDSITGGASKFVTGVLTPVMTLCSSNEVCLAFLSVTFLGIGIRKVRSVTGALGRGR